MTDGMNTCGCGTDAGPPCPCPHGVPLCGDCPSCEAGVPAGFILASHVVQMERQLTPGAEALQVLQAMVGADKGDEISEELVTVSRSLLLGLGNRPLRYETVTGICSLALAVVLDRFYAGTS